MKLANIMKMAWVLCLFSLLTACASQQRDPLNDQFDLVEAAKTRISLGLTYLKNDNYTHAKINLDRAMEFAPRLADSHYGLAYYYQQVGQNDRAHDYYESALELDPNNADIANSYGAYLCQLGRFDQAKDYFLMAVNNSNYISFAETYENLALCSYSQGKMSDAIQYLEDAINHQPGRTKSIYLRTELLIIDGQWRAAKASLEQYLRLATVGAETLLMSVKIEAGLGNVESAKEYAQMLMTMYPKSKSAERYIKSSLYKRLNELDSDMQNESSQTELRVPQDLSSLDQSAEIDDLSDIEEVPELEPTIEVEEIPEIEEVAEIEQSLDVGEGSDSDLLQESELQYETEERSESEEILELEEVVETEELPQDSEIFTIEDLDDGLSQSEAETSEDDDLLLNYEAEYDDNYEDTQTHHIVEKDQNLFRISKKYNIKMSRLIEWNELSDPAAIKAGMRILIVDPANLQESKSNE